MLFYIQCYCLCQSDFVCSCAYSITSELLGTSWSACCPCFTEIVFLTGLGIFSCDAGVGLQVAVSDTVHCGKGLTCLACVPPWTRSGKTSSIKVWAQWALLRVLSGATALGRRPLDLWSGVAPGEKAQRPAGCSLPLLHSQWVLSAHLWGLTP